MDLLKAQCFAELVFNCTCYCYALHKVNELKNSHNKDYDIVLQTRADAILSRELLDSLVGTITEIRDGLIPEQDSQGNFTGQAIKDTRYNPQISDKNILSATGTFVHNYYNINKVLDHKLYNLIIHNIILL